MLVHLAPLPVGLPLNVGTNGHGSTMFTFMPRRPKALLGAAIAHGGPMGALLTFGWLLLHINLRPPPLQ